MQLSPDEICRLAYAEKPLPSEATVVDRSLYAEVRRLYDAWSVSEDRGAFPVPQGCV